jgi:hypothetical protein
LCAPTVLPGIGPPARAAIWCGALGLWRCARQALLILLGLRAPLSASADTRLLPRFAESINNAVGIQMSADEVSSVFELGTRGLLGLQHVHSSALERVLRAHGKDASVLRAAFISVFGGSGLQDRRKDMDLISGCKNDWPELLKPLDAKKHGRKPPSKSKPVKASKTAKPAAKTTRPRTQGSRRPRAMVARDEPLADAVEDPEEEAELDGTASDAGYDTDEEYVPADEDKESAGAFKAILLAEMESLARPEDGLYMAGVIQKLTLLPLFDTSIKASQEVSFTPPAWLTRSKQDSLLHEWLMAMATIKLAESKGARIIGFEVLYQHVANEAPRLLFACYAEILHDGVSAALSYVDSDRAMLPDDAPKTVPSSIFRAGMLTMMHKLARCGATRLWLSACSPEWLLSKDGRSMYPDCFMVATSGKTYLEQLPARLSKKEKAATLLRAQVERTKQLAASVYPKLLERAFALGLVLPGAGRFLATPGMGAFVPPFPDELFTKTLQAADHGLFTQAMQAQAQVQAAEKHWPSTSPLADAALAVTNDHSPIFFAALAVPEALTVQAAQLAVPMTADVVSFCVQREAMFKKVINAVMALKAVPAGFGSLGQLARNKLRAFYLDEQMNPLAA